MRRGLCFHRLMDPLKMAKSHPAVQILTLGLMFLGVSTSQVLAYADTNGGNGSALGKQRMDISAESDNIQLDILYTEKRQEEDRLLTTFRLTDLEQTIDFSRSQVSFEMPEAEVIEKVWDIDQPYVVYHTVSSYHNGETYAARFKVHITEETLCETTTFLDLDLDLRYILDTAPIAFVDYYQGDLWQELMFLEVFDITLPTYVPMLTNGQLRIPIEMGYITGFGFTDRMLHVQYIERYESHNPFDHVIIMVEDGNGFVFPEVYGTYGYRGLDGYTQRGIVFYVADAQAEDLSLSVMLVNYTQVFDASFDISFDIRTGDVLVETDQAPHDPDETMTNEIQQDQEQREVPPLAPSEPIVREMNQIRFGGSALQTTGDMFDLISLTLKPNGFELVINNEGFPVISLYDLSLQLTKYGGDLSEIALMDTTWRARLTEEGISILFVLEDGRSIDLDQILSITIINELTGANIQTVGMIPDHLPQQLSPLIEVPKPEADMPVVLLTPVLAEVVIPAGLEVAPAEKPQSASTPVTPVQEVMAVDEAVVVPVEIPIIEIVAQDWHVEVAAPQNTDPIKEPAEDVTPQAQAEPVVFQELKSDPAVETAVILTEELTTGSHPLADDPLMAHSVNQWLWLFSPERLMDQSEFVVGTSLTELLSPLSGRVGWPIHLRVV